MEFSQTSGSKPELDRGTGILKYDGDTANGQAVSLGGNFFSVGAGQKRFLLTWDHVVLKTG
jgi:hypothetical protein